MEEILTAEQVAKLLQVHPFTVLKFIKQKKLKAMKLGRMYRIRQSDVDAFLDSLTEKDEKPTSLPPSKGNVSRNVSGEDVKELKKPESVKQPPKPQKPEEDHGPDYDHYKIELKPR